VSLRTVAVHRRSNLTRGFVCSISLQSDRDVANLLKTATAGLRDVSASSLGKRGPHVARFIPRISRQIIQLLPSPGTMRLDRRHRHLGSSARDQDGKDNPEWFFLTGIGCASENESEGAAGALNSFGDARVGRLEAVAVPSFEGANLLGEAAGHREKIRRINIGGDMSSEASQSLGGQRRRYE
jgi:hypothetical protein